MHSHANPVYPPGPKPRFPWRYLGKLPDELPDALLHLAEQYGDIVHFMFGRQHIYLLNHPDFIQEVLITQQRAFSKGRVMQQTRSFLGNGLLTAEADLHLEQRRMVQPLFQRQQVSNYAQSIVQLAQEMSQSWQSHQAIDLAEEMTRLSMKIITRVLFLSDLDQQTLTLSEDIQILRKQFDQNFAPHSRAKNWLFASHKNGTIQAQARLDTFIQHMVAAQNGTPGRSMLTQLIQARDAQGHPMQAQQIRDHLMTLFLAGHETTASALSWTFYLLAQYPQVTERLSAELDSVLGGSSPSADSYPQLVYTKMALTESMRLYPPAWVLGRQTRQTVNLGGYTLPEGALVLLSQWVTHHDPRYYPNPYLFKPERWLPEARAVRPKLAYFPFGGGQRLCIGEHFAWLVGILTIATVLQTWRFEQIPGRRLTPRFTLTLRPENSFVVRVVPIKL